jgi:UDP-glucose 4-epimerase
VTFIESMRDGEPREIHGDGQQTRTFTHVRDTADGVVRALERPEARGEVINIGGTETITILELARLVQAEFDLPPEPLRASFVAYESLPGKYQDVRHRTPDTSKARRLLGFDAQIRLADGLRETVEWHRAIREARAAAGA